MKRIKCISGFSWDRRKTIILAVSITIVVLWGLLFSHAVEKYGQQYAISLTALLVASIAAVATLFSLRWSRDTVRPFLSLPGAEFSPDIGEDYVIIQISIRNSGSLPATDVDVDMDFFAHDEEVTEKNRSSKFTTHTKSSLKPMILPNSHFTWRYELNLKDRNHAELWQNIINGKIKFRLRIRYESLGRKHLTIQTERIQKPQLGRGLVLVPIPPQKWV
jgi:hypothetical protein